MIQTACSTQCVKLEWSRPYRLESGHWRQAAGDSQSIRPNAIETNWGNAAGMTNVVGDAVVTS
ncbi:MAG: hypothetical protein CL693_00850 [Cellvibrionaceae bacterium]|nr:hypothetical protein [Cellvibrionaceae bacterium]